MQLRATVLSLLAAVAGGAAFFQAVPDGIRRAEGCAAAPNVTCTSPGWGQVMWATPPDGVPTDGAVRVRMTATYACTVAGGGAGGAGGSADAAITVRGPDGVPVPGSPDKLAAPEQLSLVGQSAPQTQSVIAWRATAPLAPSTQYTLHVDAVSGGVDLSFTTGPGPYAAPKPVLTSPAVTTTTLGVPGPTICCSKTTSDYPFCSQTTTTTCAERTATTVPAFKGTADVDEPVAAARAFLTAELQLSVDDGPFAPSQSVVSAKSSICARVLGTNTLTGQTTLTQPWCQPVPALDPTPFPNCTPMKDVLNQCGAGGGSASLSPGAQAAYAQGCSSAGAGGAGAGGTGAGGASGNGSAGTGAAGSSGNGSAGTGAAGASGNGSAGTGAGGASGNGSAGTGTAGASGNGSAGTGAAGGGAGGSSGNGAGVAGGSAGAGTPGGANGGSPAAADSTAADDGGCTIRVGAGAHGWAGGVSAALLALAVVARRSRAERGRRR